MERNRLERWLAHPLNTDLLTDAAIAKYIPIHQVRLPLFFSANVFCFVGMQNIVRYPGSVVSNFCDVDASGHRSGFGSVDNPVVEQERRFLCVFYLPWSTSCSAAACTPSVLQLAHPKTLLTIWNYLHYHLEETTFGDRNDSWYGGLEPSGCMC